MNQIHLITIGLILSLSVNAQGLNNEQYPIDESDIKNINSIFHGIDTYKFFVNAKSSEDLDVKIVTYKYGEKVGTKTLIKSMIESYGINPIDKKNGDDFIRIYIQNSLADKNEVKIGFKYLNITSPKLFPQLDLKFIQTRAFSDVPSFIEKNTPVLAVYGNYGGNLISCPGDAKSEDVIKLYDWVSLIYIDKLDNNISE
ncbi:hypothetical protein [Marinigracilibium pacificum]|uniref:Uncharacterized protein n=1 Tax=Marinigracilibium pacificum TaxID=2729599 RepID=A0A848J022_9BACT|nr:hypothetical protein [Marinigracilibium pacificum]NMM47824.1 hypothetical protein [Marinigracilibium pacificum]